MRKQYIIYIFVIIYILLLAEFSLANDKTQEIPDIQELCELSGKVVDLRGKPLSSFILVIQSIVEKNGQLQPAGGIHNLAQPIEQKNKNRKPPSTFKVITRTDGSFDVSEIRAGLVQVHVLPKNVIEAERILNPNMEDGKGIPAGILVPEIHEPDTRVVSIKLGKVTYFNNMDDIHRGERLTFKLKPGISLKEVIITVKRRLKFTVKVVYSDGSPMINSEGSLSFNHQKEENPNSGGNHSEGFTTNAKGIFTKYIKEPGYYTLSVKCRSLKGGIGPFLLKEGIEQENLVIQLDGNPTVTKPVAKPRLTEIFGIKKRTQPAQQKEKPIWIINPHNGHAYALIECNGWQDAQKIAIKEGAHIVSINSEEEQFWLTTIFPQRFWIGLNDVEEEGKWQWDSGEPITYFNWGSRNRYPDNDSVKEKDYVVSDIFDNWQPVGSHSRLKTMTHHAIIEKDGLVSIPIKHGFKR